MKATANQYELTYIFNKSEMPSIEVYSQDPKRVYWLDNDQIYVFQDANLSSPISLGVVTEVFVFTCMPKAKAKIDRFNELYNCFSDNLSDPQERIHIKELIALWRDKDVQETLKLAHTGFQSKREWVHKNLTIHS